MPGSPNPALSFRRGRARLADQFLGNPRRVGTGSEMLHLFGALLALLIACSVPAQQPAAHSQSSQSGPITETELKRLLMGKFLYLRGGYLDNTLVFNQHGELLGHSPQGSYTLNVIRIESLHLTSRSLDLRGVRYGLHFLGALPSEDLATAVDRVQITARKKWLRISIARLKVVKPKKNKKDSSHPPALEPPDSDTTTSPAYSASILRKAIDDVFAPDIDARMMAKMPQFWQLYYRAVAAKTDFQPAGSQVVGVSGLDSLPRLRTRLDAPSNQYAQQCGVAGMALYRAVVGADGLPQEIAVVRPIGFGLDETAVSAIRAARFDPAMQNGKRVPVLIDFIVEFRIYSKRTDVAPANSADTSAPVALPAEVGPGRSATN